MAAKSSQDPVLAALDGVVDALRENARVNQAAVRQARDMVRLRSRGLSWRQIFSDGDHPLVVEMLTDNLERIQTSGSTFRRASAAALHGEGATMEEIGALFGVSRQRVSSLLAGVRSRRPPRAQPSAASGRRSSTQSTRRASDQSRSRL